MELAENGDLSVQNHSFFRVSSRKSTRTAKISTSFKYGRSDAEFWGVSKLFTKPKSSIGIWNRPTYFLARTTLPKSGTWTFRSCWTRTSRTLRQALRITQALRSGTMNLTVSSATFGHSAACCTKCVPWSLHSKPKTWMRFIKKFSAANTRKYQRDTPQNSNRWFHYVSNQNTEERTSVSWCDCLRSSKLRNRA